MVYFSESRWPRETTRSPSVPFWCYVTCLKIYEGAAIHLLNQNTKFQLVKEIGGAGVLLVCYLYMLHYLVFIWKALKSYLNVSIWAFSKQFVYTSSYWPLFNNTVNLFFLVRDFFAFVPMFTYCHLFQYNIWRKRSNV